MICATSRSLSAGIAALVVAATLAVSATASATTFIVNTFEPAPVPAVPTPNAWYASDIRGAGTATIVDLTGAGGDLETNQPLPISAARLTTDFDNNDKAEVATFADFGDAGAVLNSAALGYSYYKATVVGGNAFAAPTLKLGLFSPVGGGDNFGQLIYEPTWNQPGGGSAAVPTDAWQTVTIGSTTGGGGDDATGGWWWTGGFEVPNSFGGPPLKSLEEWASVFSAADADFAAARVVSVAVGVGTFNQGQDGYFDEVTFGVIGGTSTTWDFEVIPEPASALLLALGGAFVRRRR